MFNFNSIVALLLIILPALSASSKLSPLYTPVWKGPSPHYCDSTMVQHAKYLIESYREVANEELIPLWELSNDDEENARRLFHLQDRVVLSHGIQPGPPVGDGPILNYGTQL